MSLTIQIENTKPMLSRWKLSSILLRNNELFLTLKSGIGNIAEASSGSHPDSWKMKFGHIETLNMMPWDQFSFGPLDTLMPLWFTWASYNP
jgi:hypothetical protein